MHKLIIFDVDGTLTPGMEGATFPDNVVAKLITLRPTSIKLALASNQGDHCIHGDGEEVCPECGGGY